MSNHRFLVPLDEDELDELQMNDDVWRPCPNYPGYDASWNGWVRSWTVPNHTVHGYYYEVHRVNPKVNGVVLNRHRGQLVADAFLVQPEPQWNLTWLDGDKTNHAAKNLNWEDRLTRVQRANQAAKLNGNRPHKSHCIWGHELSGDLVRITGDGSNMCIVCSRAHASRYQEIKTLKKKGLPHDHVTHEYVLKRKGVWVPEEQRPEGARKRPRSNKKNQKLREGRITHGSHAAS